MFHSPIYFLLILLLPWLGWRLFVRRRRAAIPFSSVDFASELKPTWRQRLAWLPAALTLLAFTFTIVALAQPREGRERTISDSEGIAIEMVVDRSGSMQAMDFKIDGENIDRLTAIKNVVASFVLGDEHLDGRFSDLIGLVSFAGYADGITPLTLDHTYLVSQLSQTQIVTHRSEDGTAIGDAISLAVEKLTALDQRQKNPVTSKVIILLTDGENNAGEFEPVQAAELAAKLGIKIYTIGVGTKGRAPVPVIDGFTGREEIRWMDVNIDEATLKKVAQTTGGKYFRATDTDSLQEIYREIDLLEKTTVESKHFVDYRELAVQPWTTRWGTVPPIVTLAFGCLLARWLLEQMVFRQLI